MIRRRLDVLLLPLIAAGLVATAPTPAAAAPKPDPGWTATIVLVRHAEKDTAKVRDVTLSAAGQQRAATLAGVLREAGVWRCFATPTQRATQTATPTAQAIGDSVRIVAGTPEQVKRLQSEAWGHTVLVVGHSNTVPEMVALLTGTKPRAIADDEFDLMYIVTLHKKGAANVVLLHYGEPKP